MNTSQHDQSTSDGLDTLAFLANNEFAFA